MKLIIVSKEFYREEDANTFRVKHGLDVVKPLNGRFVVCRNFVSGQDDCLDNAEWIYPEGENG